MTSKTTASLAFAAGCMLALGAMSPTHAQTYPQPPMQYSPPPQVETNGPQASRGDFGDWSARQNNIESAHYDRLVQSSPGFRHARMRKECGPIGDPQLHEQCMASFQEYEPAMYGSSTPPWQHRHNRASGN
jgi:hypothetical protein